MSDASEAGRTRRATQPERGSISQPPLGGLGAGNTVVEDAKFQLGTAPAAPGVDHAEAEPRTCRLDGLELPWAYGDDRITAMVRSPDSLYLYWEITDPAIASARGRLGAAGAQGWCNLRVYDTTGRAFDGTNANHYFDITIERTDREYFLALHRPTASVHVEIGIKSPEGYFQAIARSGRADFPRKGPSPNHSLEWMTVTSDAGHHPAARPYVSKHTGSSGSASSGARSHPAAAPPTSPHAIVGGHAGAPPYAWVHPAFTEVRWEGPWFYEWRSEWRLRWLGPRGGETSVPLEGAEWVAGPFPTHLLDAGRIEVRFLGDAEVVVQEAKSGLHVFGPWEVRIQSFGAGSERRELAAWRVHFARVEPMKVERWWSVAERARLSPWQRTRVLAGGESESHALVEAGASEMWRLAGSERWSVGASEWLTLGASEIAWGGASELLLLGASALLYGGASGVTWGGASEVSWGGASEHLYRGASEVSWGGASEYQLGGASELQLGGASPHVAGSVALGGASPHVAGSLMVGASEAYAEWLKKMGGT